MSHVSVPSGTQKVVYLRLYGVSFLIIYIFGNRGNLGNWRDYKRAKRYTQSDHLRHWSRGAIEVLVCCSQQL